MSVWCCWFVQLIQLKQHLYLIFNPCLVECLRLLETNILSPGSICHVEWALWIFYYSCNVNSLFTDIFIDLSVCFHFSLCISFSQKPMKLNFWLFTTLKYAVHLLLMYYFNFVFPFSPQFAGLRADIDLTWSHPEPEGRNRAHRTVREIDVLGDGGLLIIHLYSPQLLPGSRNISSFFKTRVEGLEDSEEEEEDDDEHNLDQTFLFLRKFSV